MIYCNLSDDSRKKGIEIRGNDADIRDELAALFTELRKTDIGQLLINAALVQCAESEILSFPDPNRRRKA